MKFSREFVQELLIAFIAAVSGFVATQIKDISTSVQQLNINVSVLVERVTNQGGKIEELDRRLTVLETRR